MFEALKGSLGSRAFACCRGFGGFGVIGFKGFRGCRVLVRRDLGLRRVSGLQGCRVVRL